MTDKELTPAQRNFRDILAEQTGLPAIASREELEVMGAKLLSTRPIKINDKPSMYQLMIYRPDATNEMVIWERNYPEQKDFTIAGRHLLGDFNARAEYQP